VSHNLTQESVNTHLWSGDNDSPVHLCCTHIGDNRQVFIRSARWSVYDEIVNCSPVNVSQELFDETWVERERKMDILLGQ